MDIGPRTRRDIRERIDRLRGEYGNFEVVQGNVANEPDFFEHGLELVREGWRGDAGALVRDQRDRVLLIRHAGSPEKWGHPGGGHEPGETMEETAEREVREETGVECDVVDVNCARHKTIYLDSNPDRRFHMLTVIFEAEYREGEIAISDEEVLEAKWFDEVPENALEFVQQRMN